MPDHVPSAEPSSPSPEVIPPVAPRPSTGRRPGLTPVVVLVVAIAAAVVLSAVFLGGLTGSGSGGTTPTGTGPTFSLARGVADQFAAAHGGGTLFDAVGLDLYNASYLPYNGSTGNASCVPVTLVGTVPANITIPAFRGNLESGEAPVWLFGFVTPTGELAVFEVAGQITLAVEVPSSCITGFSQFHGFSTTVVDSPVAVAAAAAAGGASFLRAHPTGVSLLMDLVGGFSLENGSLVAPLWEVSWSTCSSFPFSTGGPSSGYEFSAIVNATTGSVGPSGVENTTCGSTITTPTEGIAGAISLGFGSLEVGPGTDGTIASQGCDSGDYCYMLPITSATENVTPADFDLSVVNFSDESPVTTTAGFAIVNSTGTVLVYSVGADETQWTPTAAGNPQTLLSAGMEIYVDVGPSHPTGADWGLDLTGEGPFANSGLGISL